MELCSVQREDSVGILKSRRAEQLIWMTFISAMGISKEINSIEPVRECIQGQIVAKCRRYFLGNLGSESLCRSFLHIAVRCSFALGIRFPSFADFRMNRVFLQH